MTDTIRCFNCSKNIPVGVEKRPVCGFTVSGAKIEAIKEATDLNAEVSLSEAIKLKPGFAAAYTARGDVYSASSDYDAAVKDYSKALELYPDYAQAYKKRAQAWIEIGGGEEAVKDLEGYLFYRPHDARARRRLEKLKEGVG